VLTITSTTGSYAVAGACSALFGVSSVILAPFRARLIDRRGARRALPPMAALYASLLVVLAVVDWRPGTPRPVLLLLCVVAGATTPPLGPTMRALWAGLVEEPVLRRRAFALDTVSEEVLYVTGPLLAGGLAALINPGGRHRVERVPRAERHARVGHVTPGTRAGRGGARRTTPIAA
jgi:MFS family permease